MSILLAALPVLGVLALLFGMGAQLMYIKKKELFHSNRSAIVAVDDTWRAIAGRLDDIKIKLDERQKVAAANTGPTMRVYSVLLARGLETRLLTIPAQTFEEMIEGVTREYGLGWMVAASCYVDMKVATLAPETLKPKAEKPTVKTAQEFVTTLEYARGEYATTNWERGVMKSIINRLKRKHGISSTTT